jgi:hypothetical protein
LAKGDAGMDGTELAGRTTWWHTASRYQPTRRADYTMTLPGLSNLPE